MNSGRPTGGGGHAARHVFQAQIAPTDHQIDRLVYELYGLTEDEIKIVEGEGNHE